MPTLELRPTHKPVREYYRALQQFSLLHATHEGAVSAAFGSLLHQCANKLHWTLVPQFELKRRQQHPLRVDGAVVDRWSLVHGYWEAKDAQDDLAVEAKKKIDKGYPTDNIIFQLMSSRSSSATSRLRSTAGRRPSMSSRRRSRSSLPPCWT
jgi:hypothetical protein